MNRLVAKLTAGPPGSCPDLADFNHQVWAFLHRQAVARCEKTRTDFRIHHDEFIRLGELSYQNLVTLCDPIISHFNSGLSIAEFERLAASMHRPAEVLMAEAHCLAHRYWSLAKQTAQQHGCGITKIRYGLSVPLLEYVVTLSDSQIRRMVQMTPAGRLSFRFDTQLICGFGQEGLFQEALNRILLQSLNASV